MSFYRHTIPDPHSHLPFNTRPIVQGRIDPQIYNYFFRQVLAGDRGPRSALVNTFFQKFYEACLEAKIPPVWSEENEDLVNNVLQRMNFKGPRTAASKKGPK